MGNGLEIERKYLLSRAPSVNELAALGARPISIEQAYLRSDDDWVRRVRRSVVDGRASHVLTRKRELAGIVREELEEDVSPTEYARLLAQADPDRRIVRKTRHVIRHGTWTLELDVFDDPPGLTLLEVELDDADLVPDLPPSIAALLVREVSLESAYTNHMLALRQPGVAEGADATSPAGAPADPATPDLDTAAS